MRRTSASSPRASIRAPFYAVSLLGLLAACATSAESADQGASSPGSSTESPGAAPAPKEPPLEARPVCQTIATSETFAKGCSGSFSGSGDALCRAGDAPSGFDSGCESDTCLYDSRGDLYSFYCAASCKAGDDASCPLGFECRAETCGGGATFCAKRTDFACTDTVLGLGTNPVLFEGVSGETLLITRQPQSPSTGELKSLNGDTLRTLTTWNEPTSSSSGITVLRGEGKLLVITGGGSEIEITPGRAKASAPTKRTSSTPLVYGTDKDGTFVALDGVNSYAAPAFVALLRRDERGSWAEVGPTKQRISTVRALNTGFVARCQDTVCVSFDGETFTELDLPSGISLDDTETSSSSAFAVAGASPDDFYLARAGRLVHYAVRNGEGSWVEEGPRGEPDAQTGGATRVDQLRAFADGSVAFSTPQATGFATYAVTDGCWRVAPTQYGLDRTALVKGGFGWVTTSSGVCVLPAR